MRYISRSKYGLEVVAPGDMKILRFRSLRKKYIWIALFKNWVNEIGNEIKLLSSISHSGYTRLK